MQILPFALRPQPDQVLQQNLSQVSDITKKNSDDVVMLKSKIVRQENITERLLIPMFTDLFQMFISHMASVLDETIFSNMKHALDRYLSQLQRAREGKHFLP